MSRQARAPDGVSTAVASRSGATGGRPPPPSGTASNADCAVAAHEIVRKAPIAAVRGTALASAQNGKIGISYVVACSLGTFRVYRAICHLVCSCRRMGHFFNGSLL